MSAALAATTALDPGSAAAAAHSAAAAAGCGGHSFPAAAGEAGGQPFDAARADALARFARFTHAATQDTARIAALAGEPQGHLTNPRPWLRDGHGFEIIRPRIAPPEALAPFRPYRSDWLGGNVTLLWGG